MALITKHDTDGNKGLLAKGELGLDDTGLDAGRVYVGDGTNNVPMAKKSETDTLTIDLGILSDTVETNFTILDNKIDAVVEWASGDKIITVADSGADFTTVMGAIAEAMKWRSIDGSVIVEIQSGYLVREQLIFTDNDYSHINIKAQNGATIIVDHNSMSVINFEGSQQSGFIVCARGKSPMFQTQFEFLTRPTNTISGVLAIFNGTVCFGNNSGVKNAGNYGAFGSHGGSVTMGDNNNFSNAGRDGAYGYKVGSVTMGDSNDFSNAGGNGALGHQGGSVTMGNHNDFSNAGGNGAYGSRGGSITMGDSNDFSNAGSNGALGHQGCIS